MKRTRWLWAAVSVATILTVAFGTRAADKLDESGTTSTGKQRIVQIATAELPPKADETMHRYILASMPGDTVAVLFIDQHLYAMRKDGTLEQAESSEGGWAVASGGGTAFAVMHNVGRPKDLGPHALYLPVQAKTFDRELKPVAQMRIDRHQRLLVSNDGELIVGVGPSTEHTPGSNASCFYRKDAAPRAVASGAGGFAYAAALSVGGDLFVLGGSRGILAYDGHGNSLWQGGGEIGGDDLVTSVSILEAKGRVAITRCVQCALPVEGEKGESLRLFDLKGNIVTDAKPSTDVGLVKSSIEGEILVRRFASSLLRIDPIDGHQLWRTTAEELRSIDDTIVTEAAIFAYDGHEPMVQAISMDGEAIDTWRFPGEGNPWGFASSIRCPERFVTARSNAVFVCELREE